MTSTNFTVGLEDMKNSSRVLKPPGGGHTDIFGISGHNEFITPNKKKNHPSSITGCFTHEENVKTVDIRNKDEVDVKNGNVAADENTKPNNDTKEEEKKNDVSSTAARRVRVPPGGFSSGLW